MENALLRAATQIFALQAGGSAHVTAAPPAAHRSSRSTRACAGLQHPGGKRPADTVLDDRRVNFQHDWMRRPRSAVRQLAEGTVPQSGKACNGCRAGSRPLAAASAASTRRTPAPKAHRCRPAGKPTCSADSAAARARGVGAAPNVFVSMRTTLP